jgi:hypothetical protein
LKFLIALHEVQSPVAFTDLVLDVTGRYRAGHTYGNWRNIWFAIGPIDTWAASKPVTPLNHSYGTARVVRRREMWPASLQDGCCKTH